MDDLISRQAAIALVKPDTIQIYDDKVVFACGASKKDLEELPAVAAIEVKCGKWDDEGKCSSCGCYNNIIVNNVAYPLKTNYCPYCGAKMDGE